MNTPALAMISAWHFSYPNTAWEQYLQSVPYWAPGAPVRLGLRTGFLGEMALWGVSPS